MVWLKRQPAKDDDGKTKSAEWLPYSARLLSLPAAAGYVGVSTWVIRGWLAAGLLTRVKLPRPGGGEMERLLLDVTDLDALIESGKDRSTLAARAYGEKEKFPGPGPGMRSPSETRASTSSRAAGRDADHG